MNHEARSQAMGKKQKYYKNLKIQGIITAIMMEKLKYDKVNQNDQSFRES